MSNKTRLVIWSIFIVVSIVFAFANDGIRETWWMLLIFLLIPVVYETVLYFKMRNK